jgi:hypothetical protein
VRRKVTTTRIGAGSEVLVREGLIGGEDLIITPPASLHDGDRVKANVSGSEEPK